MYVCMYAIIIMHERRTKKEKKSLKGLEPMTS